MLPTFFSRVTERQMPIVTKRMIHPMCYVWCANLMACKLGWLLVLDNPHASWKRRNDGKYANDHFPFRVDRPRVCNGRQRGTLLSGVSYTQFQARSFSTKLGGT